MALSDRAGVARPLPAGFGLESGDEVFDLHEARDLAALEHDWLLPASASLARGELQQLALDFADGRGWILARGQRWRFWRRPQVRLDACLRSEEGRVGQECGSACRSRWSADN